MLRIDTYLFYPPVHLTKLLINSPQKFLLTQKAFPRNKGIFDHNPYHVLSHLPDRNGKGIYNVAKLRTKRLLHDLDELSLSKMSGMIQPVKRTDKKGTEWKKQLFKTGVLH